ncbi:MAG: transcription antitermination factor NusB [Acidimicrobiia bacterium]
MSQNKLKTLNTTRALIVDLLVKCNQGSYSNEIVPSTLAKSSFSPSDKALITRVVYSTLRNQIRIDNAINKISSKNTSKLDDLALNALRSIFGQLLEGFDMYAVLNETVKVMPFNLKGFVNGVSRKALKLDEEDKLFINETLSVKYSMPEWIVDEIKISFKNNVEEILKSLNSSGQVTLAPYKSVLPVNGKYTQGSLVEDSRVLTNARSVSDLDEIKNGTALVVDQSSQYIINQLDVENKKVLDLCCAPGGKSFLMSQHASNVVSVDLSISRLSKMLDTKSRLKTTNIKIVSGDCLNLPFAEGTKFDVIYLDAPCSGLGVLRRRPDARNNIDKSIVDELSQLQEKMLNAIIGLLAPGGRLVYSVCTFTKSETVDVIENFLSRNPQFESTQENSSNGHVEPLKYGSLIIPGTENDSMYYCQLQHKII